MKSWVPSTCMWKKSVFFSHSMASYQQLPVAGTQALLEHNPATGLSFARLHWDILVLKQRLLNPNDCTFIHVILSCSKVLWLFHSPDFWCIDQQQHQCLPQPSQEPLSQSEVYEYLEIPRKIASRSSLYQWPVAQRVLENSGHWSIQLKSSRNCCL